MIPLLLEAAVALASLALCAWMFIRYVQPLRRLRAEVDALAGNSGGAATAVQRLGDRLREMDAELNAEILNLQAVLGSLSEGVLIIDRNENVRLANAGLQRMLGLANPPLRRPLLEVLRHHDVREAARHTLIAGEGCALAVSLTVRGSDGLYGTKHFQLTTSPLMPHGVAEPVGATVVLHDITQLKNLENVRRDFVANVSHELRTPLSIINGYLETMLEPGEQPDAETTRRFHEVMWKHGQRLRLILDDLMTLARLENPEGAGAMRFAPVALGPCLEGAADALAPVVAERRAAVRVEVPPDLPFIDADADRLDQVFVNLIDNALKHAAPPGHEKSDGGLEVVARGELAPDPAADGAPAVHLTLTDNGQGIPLADQPHLFERFYRVHKDRFRQSGGTGLGLSIVKHIVKAHGGRVLVESVPGEGATFHVWLPVRQPAAVIPADDASEQAAEPPVVLPR